MQELIDYIKESLKAGASKTVIRKKLLNSGWNDEEINNAFANAQSHSNKIIKKLKLIIIVPIIAILTFLTLGIVAFFIFKRENTTNTNKQISLGKKENSKNQEKEIIENQTNGPILGQKICDISGQKKLSAELKNSNLNTIAFPESDSHGNNQPNIIARVLDSNPLFLEWLDNDNAYFPDDILRNMATSQNDVDIVSKLLFNDIIIGNSFTHTTTDGHELGFGEGIQNIKKLSQPINYIHKELLNNGGFYNRSGILIEYKNDKFDDIRIYKDGQAQYQNNYYQVLSSYLNKESMRKILELFKQANFNSFETNSSDLLLSAVDSSIISLICNRFQKIYIQQHQEVLKPLVAEFEKIINELKDKAKIILIYSGKKIIKQWPFADVINPALKYNWDPSFSTKDFESETFKKLLEFHSDQTQFIDYKGEIYASNFRKCGMISSDGCLALLQLDKLDRNLFVWPTEIGIKLSQAPIEGIEIDKNQNDKYLHFLDSLYPDEKDSYGRSVELSRTLYKENDTIYEGVNTYRIDRKEIVYDSPSKRDAKRISDIRYFQFNYSYWAEDHNWEFSTFNKSQILGKDILCLGKNGLGSTCIGEIALRNIPADPGTYEYRYYSTPGTPNKYCVEFTLEDGYGDLKFGKHTISYQGEMRSYIETKFDQRQCD